MKMNLQKKIRNLAVVGMPQWMQLADKVHKQLRSAMHTVICTPYHGHIIQQPYLHKYIARR